MESAALHVDIPDDDGDALTALGRWLRADFELATQVQISAAPTGAKVIVAGVGSIAALARALSAWLATRRAKTTVRITRGDQTIEVTAGSLSTIEISRLLESLAVGLDSGPSAESPSTSRQTPGPGRSGDLPRDEVSRGHVKSTWAELADLASRLRAASDQASVDFSRLNSRLNPSAIWEGVAATAYVERYETWRVAERARSEALHDLANVVGAIVDTYRKADLSLAAALDFGPRGTAPSQEVAVPESTTSEIYIDTNDRETASRIFTAVDEVLAVFGFDGPFDVKVTKGSIRRKAQAFFRKLAANEEMQTRLVKMERALELAIIDERQAGVDEKQAAAVSGLIVSLADVPSACIRVGSVLVLKYDGGAGPVILARLLSQPEIRAMERFPEIQANPAKVLAALALALDAVLSGADAESPTALE